MFEAYNKFEQTYAVGNTKLGKGKLTSGVFSIINKETKEEKAVKIIYCSNKKIFQGTKQFVQEQQRVAKTCGLIPYEELYYKQSGDKYHIYIVMEKMDMNLSQWRKIHGDDKNTCPITFGKLQMFHLLCDVYNLHRWNMIHADIKPQNICISKQSITRLIDYDNFMEIGTSRMNYCGTCGYTPPEIDSDTSNTICRTFTEAVDIWGVGISLVNHFFNIHPFDTVRHGDKNYVNSIVSIQKEMNEMKENEKYDVELYDLLNIHLKKLKRKCNSLLMNKLTQKKMDKILSDQLNWDNSLKNLLTKKLLVKDPSKREINIENILKHKWFDEIFTKDNIQLTEQTCKLVPTYWKMYQKVKKRWRLF